MHTFSGHLWRSLSRILPKNAVFVPNRIIQIDSFLQGLQSYKKSINGKYSIIFVTSIHRIAFRMCVSGAVIDRALVACGDF